MSLESKILFKGDPSQANRAIADVQRNMQSMTQSARKMGDTIKGATRPDSIADMTRYLDKLGQQAQTTGGKIQTISSLAASFGGPWGIAIAGVAAAVVALGDKFDLFGDKAAEAAKKAQEEMENLRKKTAEDFGSAVLRTMSIDEAMKEMKGQEFKDKIKRGSEELYDLQRKALRYQGTAKGEQYAKEAKYKIDYINAQINAYNELYKVEEKIDKIEVKQRTPSKERMSRLFSMTGQTPELMGGLANIQLPAGNARLDDLLKIDPTTLSSMNQFTEYIRQMNDELNALEINSDAYNTVSNKIQQAKDTQSELLGGTKQQVDYGAELANTFGAASNSLSVFADESREAAVAQKALAVAEQLASLRLQFTAPQQVETHTLPHSESQQVRQRSLQRSHQWVSLNLPVVV